MGDYMENKQIIKDVMEKTSPKRKVVRNALFAFLFGGCVSLVGQEFLFLYQDILKLENDIAKMLMYASVILLASLATGLGIFDKFGQIAGAGSFLPITGFANSMTSASLESRSEGLIFGILSNMFKLAGTIIVTGVISAFVVSSILYWVSL